MSERLIDMPDGLFTFNELSEKYSIKKTILQTRFYKQGDRGEHLVRPVLSASGNGTRNSKNSSWRRDWMSRIGGLAK